ncbi:MAG: hypothetical protein ISR91_01535, partial [Candidatus Delongbacteria bacterium]|nr:hypothetical protein [Candidatus Delongbacteria bacterium]
MAHLLRLRSVSLLFVLIVISMSLPRTTVAQSIPHLIYGNLENYLGEFPAEADLEFCVTLRPGEPTEQTLCYPDPDQFGWDYSEETGGWRAECSEFNFWVVDDIVEVTFSTPLAAGSVQGNLDSSPAQNMGLTIIWYLPIIDPV